MSFGLDIYVDHPDGYTSGFEVVSGHTYNLAPMWKRALHIDTTRDLDGKACAEVKPLILPAIADILEHEDDYRKMEPDNGWGDFDGFWEIFTRFARMVYQHPTGRIEWNG
jgi:hypothetical protein